MRLGLSVGALMTGMGAAVIDATDWDLMHTVAETEATFYRFLFGDVGIML